MALVAPGAPVSEEEGYGKALQSFADTQADQPPVKSKPAAAVKAGASGSTQEDADSGAQAEPVSQVSMDQLIERLKNTDAIGFLTKLALRSDVMDLKDDVICYRKEGKLSEYRDELRSRFDGLVLKLMTLLEKDPSLSQDIYVARESLWKNLLEVQA